MALHTIPGQLVRSMSPSSPQERMLSQRPQRKGTRAPRACLSCRARKVRCDIAYSGGTCTKCQQENVRCVGPRTTRTRQPQDLLGYHRKSLEQASSGKSVFMDTPPSVVDCPGVGCVGGMPFGYTISHHPNMDQENEGTYKSPSISPGGPIEEPGNYSSCHGYRQTATDMSAEVTYHYYPFIVATQLRQLPPQDLAFLELQGCLLVPAQPLLDDFVGQYFLHVQPVLPLINEGDFWEVYELGSRPSPDKCISLLVLQAMLFAASAFVSPSTLQSLGHPDGRSMRIALLRRAKLLSSFESESSPIAIAQASVLLSTASMSSTGRLDTTWLGLAIENAMLAEAHLYSTLTSTSKLRKRRILKRLWWCCILRDRSMALLLRRPVHISGRQFDLSNDPLSIDDLQDEFNRSKVYGFYTKWKLAKILSQSVQLCVALTDLFILLNPAYLKPRLTQQEFQTDRLLLDRCRSDLRYWHSQAALEISSSPPTHSDDEGTVPANELGSITLYTKLVYMYYHAACIALCHLEVFYSGTNCSKATATPQITPQTQDELQNAISGLTDCHEELLSRDLAQWLPQAALAFIGLPVILNNLNIILSLPSVEAVHHDSFLALHRRTGVFIQFMELYSAKYEGVDWFGNIVRHIANLARLGGSPIQGTMPTITWEDVLACQPRSYLRLVMVLDLSLTKSRLPRDTDFPVELRGLFSVDLNAPRGLISSCSLKQTALSDDSPLNLTQEHFTELEPEHEPDGCHSEATLDQSDETDPTQLPERNTTVVGECSSGQSVMTPLDAQERTCSDSQSLGAFSAGWEECPDVVNTLEECQGWESGLEPGTGVDQEAVDRMFEALIY